MRAPPTQVRVGDLVIRGDAKPYPQSLFSSHQSTQTRILKMGGGFDIFESKVL